MHRGAVLRAAALAASASLLALTTSCNIFGGGGGDGKDPVGPQGWTESGRTKWYEATQGSRLLPLTWFNALEQVDNTALFRDNAHLESYRFLTRGDKLPAGIVVDEQEKGDDHLTFSKLRWFEGQGNNEKWIGLNCSACHTGQITHNGQLHVIDGAPSLLDFQSFQEALDKALEQTLNDAAKFDRFAKKVLPADNPTNRGMLKRELGKLVAWEKESARMNNGGGAEAPIRYGFARLDAFGHIFNKVAMIVDAEDQIANPSDAPVSYPFLWDIYRQNLLQWNGIVKSGRVNLRAGKYVDFGALGRNAGEVIGVFGDVVVTPPPASMADMRLGFRSSLHATNLDWLEVELRSLKAPAWPESFGALDQAQVDAGRKLFTDMKCGACHTTPAAGTDVYDVVMTPLRRPPRDRDNTDPWMACNAINYKAKTGNLQGWPASYFKGDKIGAEARLAQMLTTTVVGTLVGKWQELLEIITSTFLGYRIPAEIVEPELAPIGLDPRLVTCFAANDAPRKPGEAPPFAYKGRPLDGVWATAPFLHNGSVPTLYDLMLAPDKRPKQFQLGTREYDPAKGGYRTDTAAPGNTFRFDTTIRGNSNAGHDYGVSALGDDAAGEANRQALVAYLKSLGPRD